MNMTMNKKFLIISIVLISAGIVLIANSVATAQASSAFTIPLSEPGKRGKLQAHLNLGSITVKGTGRKDVLIRYSSGQDDDADRGRDADKSRAGLRRIGGGGMDLEATESNNQVKVESNSWSHALDLEIEVPSGMDLELKTYNGGELTVSGVQGELVLSNYNGEITALNVSGSVVASTYNGEIKVSFDKVSEGTPMSFSTYNGDIDLAFPASLKAVLKMKTEQGEILTGFDVKLTSSGPVQMKDNQAGVYKVVIDDWKIAEVNGGGPEITLKNYLGDIIVRKNTP